MRSDWPSKASAREIRLRAGRRGRLRVGRSAPWTSSPRRRSSFFFVFLFLGLGFWIFVGLFLVGLAVLMLQLGMPLARIGAIVKGTIWSSANSWEAAAVPMFIWMGDLIFRTDISRRLFRGLEPWVDLLPGRLLHANVAGSTLVRRGQRLERGDDRDHRQDHARRVDQPQIRQGPRHGVAVRRRRARHHDPAIDRHDHLWRPHRRLDRAPVRGRSLSRPARGRPLQRLYHRADASPILRSRRRRRGASPGPIAWRR